MWLNSIREGGGCGERRRARRKVIAIGGLGGMIILCAVRDEDICRTVWHKAGVGDPRGGKGFGRAKTSRKDLRAATMCQGWGTIQHELGHLEVKRGGDSGWVEGRARGGRVLGLDISIVIYRGG